MTNESLYRNRCEKLCRKTHNYCIYPYDVRVPKDNEYSFQSFLVVMSLQDVKLIILKITLRDFVILQSVKILNIDYIVQGVVGFYLLTILLRVN